VLRLRVTVTNPSDQDIIVTTGGRPIGSPRILWKLRTRCLDTDCHYDRAPRRWALGGLVGSPVDTIRAGGSIYAEHDVTLEAWRGGGWVVDPGEYRVRGYYNGREGLSASFTVLP
jgi:hypothetical protein